MFIILPFALRLPTVSYCEAPLCCLNKHTAVALYVLCNCDHISGDMMLLTVDICSNPIPHNILLPYCYFTLENVSSVGRPTNRRLVA